jgi:excisionase family DNA binding protein
MPRVASDWISLKEAADIFAAANVPISRSTLARWARTGRLQSIRPGRHVYVRRAEVRSMLRPTRKRVPVTQVQTRLFGEIEG